MAIASHEDRPSPPPRGLAGLPRLVLFGLAAGLAGCGGSGRIHIASLNYRAIDPPAGPAPGVTTLDLERCYWWTDEKGQVCVSMEREVPSLLGRLARFTFQMSLVLEKPPAGRARDYSVAKRELRALARVGPAQSRFTSVAGIVALYREPGDRLRGSFRLLAAREVNGLLGGWSRPSGYLMTGTFVAVHDPRRGRVIADATEAFGWQRDTPQRTTERAESAGRAPTD